MAEFVCPIKRWARAAGLSLFVSLLGLPTDVSAAPNRIVSLNLCTDELAIRLADPARIASVSWLSQEPGSNVAPQALRLKPNYGRGEEVLGARPDLVLAGSLTTRLTVAMLKRSGFRVEEFAIPVTLADVREQILRAGAVLNEQERAGRLLAGLEGRLQRVRSDSLPMRPTAIVLNPNGYTVGRDTLVDEIMSLAGLENVAALRGFDYRGQVPLEVIAAKNIDLLIVSASRDGPPSLATNLLRHPILQKLKAVRILVLPGRLWSCPGPGLAEAAERLHEAARALIAERREP